MSAIKACHRETVNSGKAALDALRRKIDAIDEEILQRINDRLHIVMEIGKLKEKMGEAVIDRTRERDIIERLSNLNKGPLPQRTLQQIFNRIITLSREIQNNEN